MSSRNTYLTPEQRISALSLNKSLKKAQTLVENGLQDAAKIIDTAAKLIRSHPETEIDYITICDPETLDDMKIHRQAGPDGPCRKSRESSPDRQHDIETLTHLTKEHKSYSTFFTDMHTLLSKQKKLQVPKMN